MTKTLCWFVTVAALVTVSAAWWPTDKSAAMAGSEAGLKRALTMYALARGLNAVISVAQGTQVAVEPAGVGAVIAVGEVLDPINDLVEQFGSMMLMAAAAFGVQLLLIKMGAHWIVCLLVTTAAIALLLWIWREREVPTWLTSVLMLLLIVRFGAPLCALASHAVYDATLSSDYQSSVRDVGGSETAKRALSGSTADLPKAPASESDRRSSWWPEFLPSPSAMKAALEELARSTGDVASIAADLRRHADQIAEHMIRIVVVFFVQTVLLPVFFLWMLVVALRWIRQELRRDPTTTASALRPLSS
jgi:hypothetical protein